MVLFFEKNFYCVSSRVEKTGQFYGCFKIGPFYEHQSLTFANTLRRTLLADRSRCTFDALQINGVEHEFSSLTGVRESVIDILLIIEKLIFQVTKPITKPQVAFVNFCGPGILRAKHIHLPPGFYCLNPSQYIATLETDAHLLFKLFFSPNWDKIQPIFENLIFQKQKAQNSRKRFFRKQFFFENNTFFKSPLNIQQISLQKKKSSVVSPSNLNLYGMEHSSTVRNKLKKLLIWKKKSRQLTSSPIQKMFLKKKEQMCEFLIFKWNKNRNFQKLQSSFFKLQVQENFLFLKSSLCAVEKVNYTIQSQQVTKNLDFQNLKKLKQTHLVKSNKFDLKYSLKLKKKQQEFEKKKDKIKSNDFVSSSLKNQKKKIQTFSNNEEFLLFEVWTNGTLHPQTAIFKAINEILLEMFPYSWQIEKSEKINSKIFNIEFNQNYFFKRKKIINISKKYFREKFLNLEIGNFYFDLETYIYLKKKKIYRIIDFLNKTNTSYQNFFNSEMDFSSESQKTKEMLLEFQTFIYSIIDQRLDKKDKKILLKKI